MLYGLGVRASGLGLTVMMTWTCFRGTVCLYIFIKIDIYIHKHTHTHYRDDDVDMLPRHRVHEEKGH